MSRFISNKIKNIAAYVPGEQPPAGRYTKLNTNECPYPPSPKVLSIIKARDNADLRLYPSPTMDRVREEMAALYSLKNNQVFVAGGSDEALAYAFMAFFSSGDNIYFPDVTYGFYKVYADLFSLNYTTVPLTDSLEINASDYHSQNGNIIIANPNAPTGIALTVEKIEEILASNPDNLVIIDEAYIDFAEEKSVVPLIDSYDNLLVIQTFSKSRALAGMRLGFAFGNEELIAGLEKVKFSFNPYNIDRISEDVALESIKDTAYLKETVDKITATKAWVSASLKAMGFSLTKSEANFLFATHKALNSEGLYLRLKADKLLVRYFSSPRIKDYLRITIGTDAEMKILISLLNGYLEEENEGK